MSTSYFPTTAIANTLTPAIVSASATSVESGHPAIVVASTSTYGQCTWSGFRNITTSVDSTLFVNVQCTKPTPTDSAFTVVITADIGGTVTTLATIHDTQSQITAYSADVPSGTDLSTVSVTVNVSCSPSLSVASTALATCAVYPIIVG